MTISDAFFVVAEASASPAEAVDMKRLRGGV